MVLGYVIVAAVVIGGLYLFVPAVHTAVINAWKTARDDLDKIAADGQAIVTRLENHAQLQLGIADAQHEVIALATKAAAAAKADANTAFGAANALKTTLSGVAKS